MLFMSLTTGSCPGSQVALTPLKFCGTAVLFPAVPPQLLKPVHCALWNPGTVTSKVCCHPLHLIAVTETWLFPSCPSPVGSPRHRSFCGNPHISGSGDGIDVLFFLTATSRSFRLFPRNPSFQISQHEIISPTFSLRALVFKHPDSLLVSQLV